MSVDKSFSSILVYEQRQSLKVGSVRSEKTLEHLASEAHAQSARTFWRQHGVKDAHVPMPTVMVTGAEFFRVCPP